MTFTRDNIVGVEFAVNPEYSPSIKCNRYRVDASDHDDYVIISHIDSDMKWEYTSDSVIHFLNNGTWIVTKNSKV